MKIIAQYGKEKNYFFRTRYDFTQCLMIELSGEYAAMNTVTNIFYSFATLLSQL